MIINVCNRCFSKPIDWIENGKCNIAKVMVTLLWFWKFSNFPWNEYQICATFLNKYSTFFPYHLISCTLFQKVMEKKRAQLIFLLSTCMSKILQGKIIISCWKWVKLIAAVYWILQFYKQYTRLVKIWCGHYIYRPLYFDLYYVELDYLFCV